MEDFPIKKINHGTDIEKIANIKEVPLLFKTTAIPFPDQIGTQPSIDLMSAITSCSNHEIYRTSIIQYYIASRIHSVRYLAYFLAFILLGNIALTLCLVSYGAANIWCFISFLTVNSILFF